MACGEERFPNMIGSGRSSLMSHITNSIGGGGGGGRGGGGGGGGGGRILFGTTFTTSSRCFDKSSSISNKLLFSSTNVGF